MLPVRRITGSRLNFPIRCLTNYGKWACAVALLMDWILLENHAIKSGPVNALITEEETRQNVVDGQ